MPISINHLLRKIDSGNIGNMFKGGSKVPNWPTGLWIRSQINHCFKKKKRGNAIDFSIWKIKYILQPFLCMLLSPGQVQLTYYGIYVTHMPWFPQKRNEHMTKTETTTVF